MLTLCATPGNSSACFSLIGHGSIGGSLVVGSINSAHDVQITEISTDEVEHLEGGFAVGEVELDVTDDAKSVDDLKRAALVDEGAVLKHARFKDVIIKNDMLVGKSLTDVVHLRAPMVASTPIVAGRGDAASVSPEGRL